MLNIVSKIFGGLGSNKLKKYENIVNKINEYESEISKLTDDQLKNKTNYFKKKVQVEKIDINKLLPEVFAVVREVANRTVKMRHVRAFVFLKVSIEFDISQKYVSVLNCHDIGQCPGKLDVFEQTVGLFAGFGISAVEFTSGKLSARLRVDAKDCYSPVQIRSSPCSAIYRIFIDQHAADNRPY